MAVAGDDARGLANVPPTSVETGIAPSPENRLPLLMLGALGVVYGDIGTSPIYALREALNAAAGGAPVQPEQVLGVLSLIFWALTIIVTIKYIAFVLRADNKGEGGILSLVAMVRGSLPGRPGWILVVGIVGAALFLGDAVITPAISVLSAVEGTEVVTPAFAPYVVPLTLVILAILFAVQRFGTNKVARVFGPVTLLWFVAIAVSGIYHICGRSRDTCRDQSALYRRISRPFARHVVRHDRCGVPCRDGGRGTLRRSRPFRTQADRHAWLWVVFPCLLLNYFGQGAFLLASDGIGRPPLLRDEHRMDADPHGGAGDGGDSDRQPGGDFGRVLAGPPGRPAQHAAALHGAAHVGQAIGPGLHAARQPAAGAQRHAVGDRFRGIERAGRRAYGISVTGNMVVTTILLFVVMHRIWKWRLAVAILAGVVFGLVDVGFFVSNLAKVLDGGWVSILVASIIVLTMVTWVQGSRYLHEKTRKNEIPLDFLAGQLLEEAAEDRFGHRRLPDQRSDQRADRADAQPQALQGAARAQCHSVDRHRTAAEGPCQRACQPGAGQRSVHAGEADLRLHGAAEYPEGAGDLPQAGLEIRHHDDVVLPVTAIAQGLVQNGNAGVAGPAVHHARRAAPPTPPSISRSRPAASSRSAPR